MIRLRGTVEYENGRQETFESGPAAIAEWELYALRHGFPVGEGAPPMLSALVVAWSALGIKEGFDVWRKSVLGVEMEAEGIPPTLPEATAASWSSSPSP